MNEEKSKDELETEVVDWNKSWHPEIEEEERMNERKKEWAKDEEKKKKKHQNEWAWSPSTQLYFNFVLTTTHFMYR